MERQVVSNKAHSNIYFSQPQGLHIIAIITLCVSTGIDPFMSLLNIYSEVGIFYTRGDYFFVIFFAATFGCISNYLLGSNKSIIHGLQFIMIALLFSTIHNIQIFGLAVFAVGLTVVISNLLFSLSSFYLKADSRRLYGFLGFFSSIILGVIIGDIIHYFFVKTLFDFRVFYFIVVFFTLIFFLKYSYKLNTSLNNKTERFNISVYGVFTIYIAFSLIVLYYLNNLAIFSLFNMAVFPIALIILTTLTLINNKEDGKKLLKYIYFCLFIIIINKIIYLTFLKYELNLKDFHINSSANVSIFLGIEYIFCLLIYFAWKARILTLKISSIINLKLIKLIFYIEIFKIILLAVAVLFVGETISLIMFILATVISLLINVFIVPVFFSLGKLLAGSKNEITITACLFLTFSSLIFISYLYA